MAKILLLGLGKVGRNVLRQRDSVAQSARLHAIADSGCFLFKRATPFSGAEISKILRWKEEKKKDAGGNERFAERCERDLKGCEVIRFASPGEESAVIGDLLRGSLREWVVIDASSSGVDADLGTAREAMGTVAYCTANKRPWAEYHLCSKLMAEARETSTLLALNCTVGVWADQMEVLPLALRLLRRGGMTVLKRDNSSLNLFFSLVDSGMGSAESLKEVEARGHLEPGATGLTEEIEDQRTKAKIAANVCGVLAGCRPSFMSAAATSAPSSDDPEEIARWHREGRDGCRTVVSRVEVSLDEGGTVEADVSYQELDRENPLAGDLPAKCAVLVRARAGSLLASGQGARGSGYLGAGFGGARRTARKLLWEAERAVRLSRVDRRGPFEPIAALSALESLDRGALSLASRLANRL